MSEKKIHNCKHGGVCKTGTVRNNQLLSWLVRLDISSILLVFYTSRMIAPESE
jgi:hypothetical protein